MEPSAEHERHPLRLNAPAAADLLVRFLKDAFTQSGFSKGVVGLSGGIDSAVAASLAAQALGKENVLGLIMPYRTSAPSAEADARLVAEQLGIVTERVDISPMVDAICDTRTITDKLRRGNVMARMRMVVMYDISARDRALVIGTSNKTELMIGYGTQFGDLASAVNPLGDLYKTQIWQLAEYLRLPDSVIRKSPSADLWEGQTDEDEIGFKYRELDSLLYAMIDERKTDEALIQSGFDPAMIAAVKEKIRSSQYKRRPPVIAKIGHRTINVDFRYGRDWGL